MRPDFRSRWFRVLAILPLVAFLSCGHAPKTFDAVHVARDVRALRPYPLPAATPASPWAAADGAIMLDRWLAGIRWRDAIAFAEAAARETPSVRPDGEARAVASASVLGNCGGDLPTCEIVMRESGGSYEAFNAGGCGGNNCYGRYQFSGALAGKLGLPEDLATATPAQQDAAARELWAGGAGASHWGA